jgi:hypothetical protein
MDGQFNREGGPFTHFAFNLDATAMALDELLAD